MSIAASMLPEYDHEMATTRRFLERVPESNSDFSPHQKSMKLGALAAHLAEIPGWIEATVDQSVFDLAGYVAPQLSTTAALLESFDAVVAQGRAAIERTADATMFENWTLAMNGEAMFTMPKVAVLRSFVMNHMIHHRAQLGVYLRLLDVPVPGAYGPSADEG